MRLYTRKDVRKVLLENSSDFSNGMAMAWGFTAYDSLIHLVWPDLLSSLFLAILSFSFSVGIKLKLYDKYT